MGKKSTPDAPKAPNYAKDYQAGIDVLLKNLPRLLGAEQDARATYDPQRIAEQQALQAQYGPTQYDQQLQALNQLDPAWLGVHDQTGAAVSSDLALGRSLSPELLASFQNDVRARQVASGNTQGNAPISAEAAVGAQARESMYQQHLDNAGQFLGSPTVAQAALAVQPVAPDRTSAYVDPNAGLQGAQYGLNNYQNMLAQQQASGGSSGWARALGGAAQGYATSGSPWGAVIGGVGGYFGGG